MCMRRLEPPRGVRTSAKRLIPSHFPPLCAAAHSTTRLLMQTALAFVFEAIFDLYSHPASPGEATENQQSELDHETISSGRSRTSFARAGGDRASGFQEPATDPLTGPCLETYRKVWRSRGRRSGVCGSHPIAFAAGRGKLPPRLTPRRSTDRPIRRVKTIRR